MRLSVQQARPSTTPPCCAARRWAAVQQRSCVGCSHLLVVVVGRQRSSWSVAAAAAPPVTAVVRTQHLTPLPSTLHSLVRWPMHSQRGPPSAWPHQRAAAHHHTTAAGLHTSTALSLSQRFSHHNTNIQRRVRRQSQATYATSVMPTHKRPGATCSESLWRLW